MREHRPGIWVTRYGGIWMDTNSSWLEWNGVDRIGRSKAGYGRGSGRHIILLYIFAGVCFCFAFALLAFA